MPFTLPEQLIWRQFAPEYFVLELLPKGVFVGQVRRNWGEPWETIVALHREEQMHLRAPAASLRQGQYFVGRWSTVNLAVIESECRGIIVSTWGLGPVGPRPPLPPGYVPSKIPKRPKRRSRRNPSSL